MPKLRGPLLSLGATGGLTKLFSLVRRGGRNIIELRPIPVDAKSTAQLFYRDRFSTCAAKWHLLSDAEKQEWERKARHMTGYAAFMSYCLALPPAAPIELERQIAQSTDDANKYWNGASGYSATAPLNAIAHADYYIRAGFRWSGVSIPQGATILEAYVRVRSTNVYNEGGTPTIWGDDQDDAGTFLNEADFDSRYAAKTAASAPWALGAWAKGDWYNSNSIAAIIQEIVNRPGWAGDGLALFTDEDIGSVNHYVYAWDWSDHLSGAILYIKYLPPS